MLPKHRVNTSPSLGLMNKLLGPSALINLCMIVSFGLLLANILAISLAPAATGPTSKQTVHSVKIPVASNTAGDAFAGKAREGSAGKFEMLNPDKAKLNDKFILPLTNEHEYPVGFAIKPTIPSGPPSPDDRKLHIIFSSGCNYFQHWQSELLLSTAHMVGQRGRITRIVSGCHDKSAENVRHSHQTFPAGKNDVLVPLDELKKSTNPNFGLFITPSFEGAKHFPWINKPSSIDYFMRTARSELDDFDEEIIAILDPDFVFLEPLTQSPLPVSEFIMSRDSPKFGDNVVKKGRPVAQRYGLEGNWVHRFDVAKIVGDPDSPATKYSSRDAAKYFTVGPPLMLHKDDLTNLAILWTQYMRPVLDVDKDILADMWAYCMAAAHLGLRHTILDNYMISTWGSSGQGFSWVDKWEARDMSCRNPPITPTDTTLKMPTYIHLASNFKAPLNKEWMFHKGHVPASILECGTPLIKESPDNLYMISEHEDHTKQKAWVLCHTVARLNKMLLQYKEKFCEPGYESRKLVRLIQRKTKDRGCSEKHDKWCFPLAQVEDLPDGWRDEM